MVISFCVTASSDNYSVQVVYLFIYTTIYKSSCTFILLNVRLDLGLVISFCVTASSDNYSIQVVCYVFTYLYYSL